MAFYDFRFSGEPKWSHAKSTMKRLVVCARDEAKLRVALGRTTVRNVMISQDCL